MVRTVVKWVLIGMIALLVLLWLWSGGFSQIVRFVRTVPNPIDILWGNSTSSYEVILPWQTAIPQGPNIDGLVGGGTSYSDMDSDAEAEAVQREYASVLERTRQLNESSNRSPHAGKVSLSVASAREGRDTEYVVLTARTSASIPISGWSLQSSLSGARATLPLGTASYMHGSLNGVRTITLESGMSALVMTSVSPVGVSFLENRCTGYLSQMQDFQPALSNACPSPAESMKLNEDNLQRYGGDCIDYVRTIPNCSSQTTMPSSLSHACRAFIANTFTYNGCAQIHRDQPSYALDTWRIYLGHSQELWRNNHDVIRLLDEYGRIVDSVTY